MSIDRNRILKYFGYFSIGFAFGEGLLFFLMIFNQNLFIQITYHYSDSLFWYFIFLVIPTFFGLFSSQLFNQIKFLNSSNSIFSIFLLQLIFHLFILIFNYYHWDYFTRRPTVFKELSNANKILTCTYISNNDTIGTIKEFRIVNDTTKKIECLYGRKDLYYGNTDRPFMLFQDNSNFYPNLSDFPVIFMDTTKKISSINLNKIYFDIINNKIIDKGEKNWDTTKRLNGIIIEFETENKTKYLHAGLSGGQVANDHYPFYEFLFKEVNGDYKLIKKQRFYIDVAGIEGLEYSTIIPVFSCVIIFLWLLSCCVDMIKIKIKTRKNDKAL